MAIQEQDKTDNQINLLFTNGDREKLEQVLEKWKFKDWQSLIRFSLSTLLVTKDGEMWIKGADGAPEKIKPSEHLLKDENGQ